MTSSQKLSSAAPVSKISSSPADGAGAAKAVASSFYEAFAHGDLGGMEAAYDPSVTFHDPLFGTLTGRHEVMEMWKTLTPAVNPKTLDIEPTVGDPKRRPDGSYEVKVHWDAHYDIGPRHIDNESDTTLIVKNGKIVEHHDDWDLSAWTKQALPHGLGGNTLSNALATFAAHTFVSIKDKFDR